MLRKGIISTLIGLAIFGAITGLLLEVMIEGDAAKFKQFAEKIKSNTLILFETAQMQTVQNMISNAHVGFELSKTTVDPSPEEPGSGDEYFLNQVSECVFSSPEDIPFPTCLICQLSDQECMPKVMCPECDKPTIFTVRYNNPNQMPGDEVRIEVVKGGNLLAEFDMVMDVDDIEIDSRDFLTGFKKTVESNTEYRILIDGDETTIIIHTSCSQDLFVGDVHTADGISLTVVSGTDADLNPTIPDASCRDTTCPECKKPTIFTVRYNNPNQMPGDEVRIEVVKGGNLLAEFDMVMDVDDIEIDSRDFLTGFKKTVESNTEYRILIDGDETTIIIHTSCSQDLFVGDVHTADGISLTVVSGTDANLNPTLEDPSCEESATSPGVNVLVEGKKILDNGYVAGTIETISLPTGPEHPENDIQNVHCVVLKVCGPPDGEGCTPGYWRQVQHFGSWVDPPYSPQCVPLTTFREAFGLGDFEGDIIMKTDAGEPGKAPTKVDTHESSIDDITLLDAIWAQGDDEGKLGRHATAAILNAANENVNYGLSQSEIIRLVQVAFGEITDVNGEFEEGDFNEIGSILAGLNDLGDEFCPLGRADLSTDACEI